MGSSNKFSELQLSSEYRNLWVNLQVEWVSYFIDYCVLLLPFVIKVCFSLKSALNTVKIHFMYSGHDWFSMTVSDCCGLPLCLRNNKVGKRTSTLTLLRPSSPWSDSHPNYNPCHCITFGSPLPLSMEDLELKSVDDIYRQVTFGVTSFCSVLELCIHNTQVTSIPSLYQAWHCAWSSVTLQIQKTLGTRATLEFYLF